ncbi:MAG TPA: dihydropteroate synthase [Bryobacteraceae bacterium]|nr:dihydropteroate synthase [Bryobacteraceae bacterium]
MTRKMFYWNVPGRELQLGERTLIMGVLNVTPDSFSDGGRFNDPDRAYARALELEEQGADIIDIGAESTKPGSQRISADEEWQRLVPVLKRLRGNLHTPLSLDTYKSEIAERAVQYGVEIFNDPSGLTFDPSLAKVAANANAGLILNHMRGLPEMWAKLPPMQDVVGTIARELEAMVNRARHAGVERQRIVIDPGLGFGKRKEQNAEILAHLDQLAALDYPILVGPSRKSFLAQASENETLFATAAAVTAAVLAGAHIVRVHDVKEMRVAVQVAEEIARAAAVKAAEVRPVARPRVNPNVDQDRPRPTRPPIAKPREEPRDGPPRDGSEPPARREFRPAAGGDRPRPPRPPISKPREDPRGRSPRDGSAPPARREFRPAAGRDRPRPPRPPISKPRDGAPRDGAPRDGSAPPARREFRPPADKRPFQRKFEQKPEGRPPRFKNFDRRDEKRDGRPPKRPFRKRP